MRDPVQITALPERTCLRLKAWLPEIVHGQRSVPLAGRDLPDRVGSILPGPLRALSVGPGEWLLVSAERPDADMRDHVALDLPGGVVLVDVSDALRAVEIQGPKARELLSKGCGLDWDPRAFTSGQCARTRLAQISVVIECTDDERFELSVARSYFDYLLAWLCDAAVEFENATGSP